MGRSSIDRVDHATRLFLDRIDYIDLRSAAPTVVTAKNCEYTGFRRNVGGTGTMSFGIRLDGQERSTLIIVAAIKRIDIGNRTWIASSYSWSLDRVREIDAFIRVDGARTGAPETAPVQRRNPVKSLWRRLLRRWARRAPLGRQ